MAEAKATQTKNLTEYAQIDGISVPTVSASASLTELDAQLKRAELEEKLLAIEVAKANLVDSRERLADRELKREQTRSRAITNGATLSQTNRIVKAQQERCNHKKGGNGLAGYVSGQGNDSNYAIITHTFANGDIEVWCSRCKKKWKRPVKSDHPTQESYDKAMAEYNVGRSFPTNNSPSGSVIFTYSDNGEMYRENTKNS